MFKTRDSETASDLATGYFWTGVDQGRYSMGQSLLNHLIDALDVAEDAGMPHDEWSTIEAIFMALVREHQPQVEINSAGWPVGDTE